MDIKDSLELLNPDKGIVREIVRQAKRIEGGQIRNGIVRVVMSNKHRFLINKSAIRNLEGFITWAKGVKVKIVVEYID